MSAGGFMAWVDVGLLLVDRMLGGAVRVETARFVLSDPAAIKARYFSSFVPMQAHGDTAVLKAQEWVHIRDGRDISLASMAAAARLERRTFLRRFANATGMTPIQYCRAVRLARARTPWVREHASKGDRSVPRVWGRTCICTRLSQERRVGAGGLPKEVRSQRRIGRRFRADGRLQAKVADLRCSHSAARGGRAPLVKAAAFEQTLWVSLRRPATATALPVCLQQRKCSRAAHPTYRARAGARRLAQRRPPLEPWRPGR